MASIPTQASPGGMTGSQFTLRKWAIRVSISCRVRALGGGGVSGWSPYGGRTACCAGIQALAHFLDPHHAAVITIAVLGRGDNEIEALIAGVWPIFTEIPFEAAGA